MPNNPNAHGADDFPPNDADTSLLRRAGDMPLRIGSSVNSTIKSLSDFFGADNIVSKTLSENSQWYEDLLSAQAKRNDQEVENILKEAQDKGVLDQLGAGLRAFSVAPADFVAGGVGSLLPFLAAGAAAKAAGLGYLGVSSTQAAMAGLIQTGAVKSSIYEEVKREMIDQGQSEEAARKVASEAQRYGGRNTDQLMVAAGLGVAGARVGAHRAITRGLLRSGFKGAREEVAIVLKEGLWEGGAESLQGGQEVAAGNFALKRENVDVGVGRGVLSRAVLEGTVGIFSGSAMAGAGAVSGKLDEGAQDGTSEIEKQNKQQVNKEGTESSRSNTGALSEDASPLEEVGNVFEINNVDELVRNGGGRVSVLRNGKDVPFKNFALDITDNEATVINVELGVGESQGKGVGYESYVALGNALAQRGVTLSSSSSQLGQGRKLWEKLAREGRAIAHGNGYNFSPEARGAEVSDSDHPPSLSKDVSTGREVRRVETKSTIPQLSPGKKKALGLVENPTGAYLVATQPHLFQGVGNPDQYQGRLSKAIFDLEKKIDDGDFLNTGFDRDAFLREHHFVPTAEHSARHLKGIRESQAEVQRGWKEYLRDGGYSQEHRLLILSSVVKEKAEQNNGVWKIHTLGGSSERRTPAADTDAVAKFVERFNGEKKPSQVLAECFAEAAAERVARRREQAEKVQVTEWGGSIAWQKFSQIPKDGRGGTDGGDVESRVKDLSETAKTVAQFGMTTWCTGEASTARHQLQGGDFWVGVDEKGRARLAVRLGGEKQIQEVSGVLPRQAMEPKYANVVNDLVQKEGFTGGERFVEDALLKGKVAEMKNPSDWEEFKSITGKSSDEEAIEFYRKYRGPRGAEDFLVGADNAELNKTLWEKTKDDGGDTPLLQAAVSGQMSAAMKWVDFSMLDSPHNEQSQPKYGGNGGSHAHTLFSRANEGAGIELLNALLRAGYLTPERQMSTDGRGNSLTHLIASDSSRVPALIGWKGLSGDSLRIPNQEGVTGLMALANNRADAVAETMATISQNGILSVEDQRQTDYSGKTLLHHLALTPKHFWADYNNPESALSLAVGQSWVDHDAIFTPDKDGKSALAHMPINGDGGKRALLFLRDNGYLTAERQQAVDNTGKNIFHKLGEEGALGDLLSWSGTSQEALLATDRAGKTPFDYYFGHLRGADIEPRLEAARNHLTDKLLFESTGVEAASGANNRKQPLIFTVAGNGGLSFLLRNGIVDGGQISQIKTGDNGISPWHVAKLGGDFASLVKSGLVRSQDFLTADRNGVTAAMTQGSGPQISTLIASGLITKEVMGMKDNEGLSLVHHAVRGGGLARMLSGGIIDREEISRLDGAGRNMLHHFDGKPWGLDSQDTVVFQQAVKSGILRSEDFTIKDAKGNFALEAFAKSPPWIEALCESGVLQREMLGQVSPSTGKRVIDIIPGKSSSTIRLLAEKGLIDRDLLLDKHEKISVLAKYIEAESEDGTVVDGVHLLAKRCGLKPEDIGAAELHPTLFDERNGETSFQLLAKSGYVTENAILASTNESIPLLGRVMAMKNGAATFGILLDGGIISDKSMAVASGGAGSSPIGKLLLSNASESPEWFQIARKAVDMGLINRDLLHTETEHKNDYSGKISRGVVGDVLFGRGNEELLNIVLDKGVLNSEDLNSAAGRSMIKASIVSKGDSLNILSDRGILSGQTVRELTVDDWGSPKGTAHYLLEHRPDSFRKLAGQGVFSSNDFIPSGDKLGEAMTHAIEKGKLDNLAGIDFGKTKLSDEQVQQGWYVAGRGGSVGAFCNFLRSTGMTDREISRSLTTPNAGGVNSLGGLATGGADRILPLVDAGVVGRKELTGEWIPGLKGSDRDALNSILSSHPEQWKGLIDRQILHTGDLYRNQSSFYSSPFRTMLVRCQTPKDEVALAKHVSESGILHEADKGRLALDTTQRASVGREALKAFVLSGDIQGQHLVEKRNKQSALDNLIELSKKEGPETLNFLLSRGLIREVDESRVRRAIAGEHSPLMDTMESVSHKVRQLLMPVRVETKSEAVALRKGESTDVARFEERRERRVLSN